MTALMETLFSIAGQPAEHRHEKAVKVNGEWHTVVFEHAHAPEGRRIPLSQIMYTDPGEVTILEVYGDEDDEHQFNLLTWFEVNCPGLVERLLWEALR